MMLIMEVNSMSRRFAVIDTETNWNNEVMSIGVLIARCRNFKKTDSRYYILPIEEKMGGMYSKSMRNTTHEIITGHRVEVIDDLKLLMIFLLITLHLTRIICPNFPTSAGMTS